MTGRFVRHPIPYLVLLLGIAYWNIEVGGWLKPQVTNDTVTYESLLEASSVEEAMSGLRSYGYPLIIRTFGLEKDDWANVPRFHFIVYSLAVLLFWLAVSRFTRSRWLAFAATVPLCFGSALQHLQLVETDSIGESLGLTTVALLLLLVVGRGRAVTATLLGLTVLLAYWTRPMYLFLVVLVPLLGVVLRLCHAPQKRLAFGRWTLGLTALTVVPLLALSAVRWNAVGQFGVSSLSGYCIGNIGALMLDEELVSELPESTQRLAREILEGREQHGLQPMRLKSRSARYQSRHFDFTLFKIVEPIVRDIVLEAEGRAMNEDGSTDLGPFDIPGIKGPTVLEMDRRLAELGRGAIRARPLIYAKWVANAMRLGISRTAQDRVLVTLLIVLALSLPVLLVRAAGNPALFERPWTEGALGVVALALSSLSYFLGHTMTNGLVHFPLDRYAVAANLLLPTVAGAGLFELWRWILPAASEGSGSSRPPRRQTLRSRIASAALAIVLGALMAETLFRVAGFDFDRQRQHLAETPIFFRKPSISTGPIYFRRAGPAVWNAPVLEGAETVEVRYDARGFRNPPDLDDWEIVVIGDGFVESGYLPQDKIFTSKLARRSRLRIKNLGVSHTGPLSHVHYLETWGKAASTRQAVLVFNEGNDLKDLQNEFGELHRLQKTGRRKYRDLSPQFSLLRAIYGRLAHAVGATQVRRTTVPANVNADLLLPGQSEARRVRVFRRVPARRQLRANQIEQLDEVMRRWAESARDRGIEPWLLYMPCKHRILHPYLRYDADVAEPIRNWKPSDLPKLVKSIATAHGIGFLDPGPRLARATANGTLAYNPVDVHLSEAGSQLVGRFLSSHLGAAGALAVEPRDIVASETGLPSPFAARKPMTTSARTVRSESCR